VHVGFGIFFLLPYHAAIAVIILIIDILIIPGVSAGIEAVHNDNGYMSVHGKDDFVEIYKNWARI